MDRVPPATPRDVEEAAGLGAQAVAARQDRADVGVRSGERELAAVDARDLAVVLVGAEARVHGAELVERPVQHALRCVLVRRSMTIGMPITCSTRRTPGARQLPRLLPRDRGLQRLRERVARVGRARDDVDVRALRFQRLLDQERERVLADVLRAPVWSGKTGTLIESMWRLATFFVPVTVVVFVTTMVTCTLPQRSAWPRLPVNVSWRR